MLSIRTMARHLKSKGCTNPLSHIKEMRACNKVWADQMTYGDFGAPWDTKFVNTCALWH